MFADKERPQVMSRLEPSLRQDEVATKRRVLQIQRSLEHGSIERSISEKVRSSKMNVTFEDHPVKIGVPLERRPVEASSRNPP